MRVSEALSIGYGAYLAIVALGPRWGWRRRIVVWILAAIMIGVPVTLTVAAGAPIVRGVRDWAPVLYIFVSYYASGTLFVGPSPAFEAWLERAERRLSPLVESLSVGRLPRPLSAAIEVLYSATFLMIPSGFAILALSGFRSKADHYWTMVELTEFVAFGMLPWLPSRPPWLVQNLQPADTTGVRRFGLVWVRRTSHCANTFPSGHTAGSLAVALAVIPLVPVAGMGLLAAAAGIAIGCVSGRYHYAIDVVAGVALAAIVWAAVSLAGL